MVDDFTHFTVSSTSSFTDKPKGFPRPRLEFRIQFYLATRDFSPTQGQKYRGAIGQMRSSSSSTSSQRMKLCPARPVWRLVFLASVHGLLFSLGWGPEHHTCRRGVLKPQAVRGWGWMVQKGRQGMYSSTLINYIFDAIEFCFPQRQQCLVYESSGSGLADLGWAYSQACVCLAGLLGFDWSRMAWIWRSWLFCMCLSHFSGRLVAGFTGQKT